MNRISGISGIACACGALLIGLDALRAATPTYRHPPQPEEQVQVLIQDQGLGSKAPIIDVTVDGERRRVHALDLERLRFVRPATGDFSISVTFRQEGSLRSMATGGASLMLNGSGVVRIRRMANGNVVIDQYATVNWEAKPTKLMIEVDGKPLGETPRKRGLSPDDTHQFVWLEGDVPRCSLEKSFPPGVIRTYTCDYENNIIYVASN